MGRAPLAATRTSQSATKQILLAGVLFASVLVVFFASALVPGTVLAPVEGIAVSPFFGEAGMGFTPGAYNWLLFDQAYQFIPWRRFAWETVRSGVLPLWGPHSSAGTPFIGTMQTAVFYPINLLLTVIPFEQTFVWSALLRLWIAGLCTYILSRRYRLGHTPALIAACTFMLSAFLVVWLGHPHTNVAVWLPALILCADWLVDTNARQPLALRVAVLSLVVGIQFTGGHIETSADILAACGVYCILRGIHGSATIHNRPRAVARLLLAPAGAVLLGTGLAAVQLVPFVEWLGLSAVYQERSSPTLRVLEPEFWRQLVTLPLLVYPNLYNNPTWPGEYAPFVPWTNYNEHSAYIGVISLALCVVAVCANVRSNPTVRIWTAIGVLSLCMALQLPGFDLLNQVPGLSLSSPFRLRLITSFSFALLAGFGAQHLVDSSNTIRISALKLLARTLWIIGLGGASLAVGTALLLPLFREPIAAFVRCLVDTEFLSRTSHSHPLEFYYARADNLVEGLIAAFSVKNLPMYESTIFAVLGVVLTLWARRWCVRRSSLLANSLLLLVILDLVTFGHGYNPVTQSERFYPTNQLVSYLQAQRDSFRMTALRQDLIPDAHLMFGLSDIRGLDFPTRWFSAYMDATGDRIPWLSYGVMLGSAKSPLLKVLNVGYVVASDESDSEMTGQGSVVAEMGRERVWQLTDRQPRGRLILDAVAVDGDDAALHMLASEPGLVYRRVLLSDAENAPAPAPFSSAGNLGYATLVREDAHDQVWDVSSARAAYLVTADAYYPGWTAYIDGNPTPLYRANLAFRALFVPEGQHRVSIRYEPKSEYLGLAVSTGSLLLVCGLFLTGLSATRVAGAIARRKPFR